MDLLGGYDSDDSSSSDANHVVVETKLSPAVKQQSLPPPAAAAPSDSKYKHKPSKKGKKVLSLASVLPQHIWNQLTNGIPDDDDDEIPAEDKKPRAAKAKPSAQQQQEDSGISSLLADLQKTKSSKPKEAEGEESSSDIQKKSDQQSSSPPQKLGHAFLTSTTTVIRKKDLQPIDVHASSTEEATVKQETEVGEEVKAAAISKSPAKVAEPESERPKPIAQRPRLAAPSVSYRPAASFHHQQQQPPAAYPSYSSSHASSQQQQPSAAAPSSQSKMSKRKQRQWMEQQLRLGNIGAVSQSSQIHELQDHHDPNAYHLGQDDMDQPKSTGIRVVPTQAYNPKTGGMESTTEVGGKQKSKSQLSSLLVSAAALQTKPSSKQTTHRATAKRKYGW